MGFTARRYADHLATFLDDVVKLTPIAANQWKDVADSWPKGEPCVIGRWATASSAETLVTFLRELKNVIEFEQLRDHLEQHGAGGAAGVHWMMVDGMQQYHRFKSGDIAAVKAALVRLDAEVSPNEDQRFRQGVDLWNQGKTWRQVTEKLHPKMDVDQPFIDATRKGVQRYANKHKIPLRKGQPGRRTETIG